MNTLSAILLREIKKLDALERECSKLVYSEIERRVRLILKGKNSSITFCMAMGGCNFYNKNRSSQDKTLSHLKGFYEFADAMNDRFSVFGLPMKINAWNGPLITDW